MILSVELFQIIALFPTPKPDFRLISIEFLSPQWNPTYLCIFCSLFYFCLNRGIAVIEGAIIGLCRQVRQDRSVLNRYYLVYRQLS